MGKASARAKAQEKERLGVTLDTGALIAIERGDRRMLALLQELLGRNGSIRVPAGVVGQAWRNGARQAVLSRFLSAPEVSVQALDLVLAKACGELCALSATADVVDASVILVARQRRDAIVTSDLSNLRRLDPAAHLEKI